ncbi:MAG: V-type ATP synthase subunit E [Halobacteriaceae archaeon]
MSLDTVVEDIREEARERREEILEDARDRRDEVIEEAEADAEEIVEEAEAEVEAEIEDEREQAVSSAKLEAKQQRLEARRDALDRTRERVEDELAELDGTRRRELTAALLDATADAFDEGHVEVYGRPDDRELVEDLLSEYDDMSWAGEQDCLGGVTAESDASRIRVDNTFDSILDDVWEDELRAVSDRLFGDEGR